MDLRHARASAPRSVGKLGSYPGATIHPARRPLDSPPPRPPPRRNSISVQSPGSTAKVLEADIAAGESGVLHVVDSMLLPVKVTSGAPVAVPAAATGR